MSRVRTTEGLVAVVFALLVVGYALWKAFVEEGFFGPRVGFGPDSQIYMEAARHPVWTLDFLAARGPFLFLLLAKVSARNLRAIVLVQSLIYVGAWIFLASAARGLMRRRATQLLAFTTILLAALAPTVVQWNVIVSTESLSVSVTCAVIAAGLRVATRTTRRNVVVLVVALALFVFVRDTNALVGLALGVAAMVLAITRPRWRSVASTIAAAGIVSAAVALALSGQSEPPRWYYPLHETIALRLVGDETAEPYFVERGLPLDDNLRALKANYFIVVNRLDDGEEFAALRAWVRREGQATYTRFLVSHPWWTLRKPVADMGRFASPDLDGYTIIWKLDPPPIYGVVGTVGWPRSKALVGLWVTAAVIAYLVLAVRRQVRPPVVLVIGLTGVLAVAGFYAAWHGDALEVDRHSLTAAVQLRVTLWLVTALAVDAVVSRMSRTRAARESGSEVEGPQQAELDEGEQPGEASGDDRTEPVGR